MHGLNKRREDKIDRNVNHVLGSASKLGCASVKRAILETSLVIHLLCECPDIYHS